MNIIAVDDERYALENVKRVINKALPDCSLSCFNTPSRALLYADDNRVELAFLDVEMGGMNGLELAKRLKEIYGRTNIVFVTGYSEYAIDSYSVPASGYIVKPVSEKAILSAMEHLRHPALKTATLPEEVKLRVQCFGNFDAFAGGSLLHFSRSKAKELFAYLIHKRGASCTIRELAAVLFENAENDSGERQIQTYISSMMKVLREAGADDIIVKKFNSLAVDAEKIDCDYYRFLKWDTYAVNSYTGEYMANYSWAEFAVGYLDKMAFKEKTNR